MRKPVILPLLHGRLCQVRGHPSCSRCPVWAPDSRVQRALEVMSVRRHRGPWWTRLEEPGSREGVRAQPQSVDSGHQLRVAAAGGDMVAHEPVCSFGPRRACCVRAPHEQGGVDHGDTCGPAARSSSCSWRGARGRMERGRSAEEMASPLVTPKVWLGLDGSGGKSILEGKETGGGGAPEGAGTWHVADK